MKLSAPIFRLKREAKIASVHDGIALHEAQDRIAKREGFQRWSHLAAHHSRAKVATELLNAFVPGDLVLLAGQREHGKTGLAFELIAEATKTGRASCHFSLDESAPAIAARFEASGVPSGTSLVAYDTSDEISASYIVATCAEFDPGSLVTIDYLQVLDQQRDKPPLAAQVEQLKGFAESTQAIVVVLSQVDRRFDVSEEDFPGLEHIRLPNPIDLAQFSKACFIHSGEIATHHPQDPLALASRA